MSFEVQTCEKECLKAEWNVVVPRVGMSVESPSISVDGYMWNFKMVTNFDEYSSCEKWKMHFRKYSKSNMPPKFLLIVHVRSKTGRHVYMTHMEICSYETEIWSYSPSSFLINFQDVEFDGNSLTFIFTLDYGIRSYTGCRNSEREHKAVQTLPYLNCLQDLSLDLSKLMDGGSDPDVQLRCGDYVCPAHKLILGARSEVFSAMLQSDMLEGREGFVEIVDMEPKVFKIFIQYLYTGILPELTEDTASLLYQAGDKYHLETLKERCSDFIVENLKSEVACGIFAMADAHSDDGLKERILTYILDEKIPSNDDVWSRFYKDHPNLAFEVLTRAYKISNCSQ